MNIPDMNNMKMITVRSYDPVMGSCVLSIRKLDIVKRIRALTYALETKDELEEIERELKNIAVLIRNLPRKKRKLSSRYDELTERYNCIIESEELPLRKLI